MKLVTQVDNKGCGLACVAMVTGKRYELVRKRAELSGNWRPGYGMDGGMLQRLLFLCGRTPVGKTFRYTQCYTHLAIVKVLADMPHPKRADRTLLFQHYVVWEDGHVYDPGPGIVWRGSERWSALQPEGVTGLDLYLATLPHGRTGLWYWL